MNKHIDVNAMLEYYAAGHSQTECAERFNVTKAQVDYYRKKHGVHGGIGKDEAMRRLLGSNGAANGNANQMRRA